MAQTVADLRLPRAFRPLFKPARHKAFHGGRGGAKSHSFAAAAIMLGRQQPLRILCCREIQKSIAASVKQLLDDKITASGQGAEGDNFYRSTQYEIRGSNGTHFLFAGLRTNPDSIKSMEGIDIAWIEEANTVSQSSLTLLGPTLRKPGSELWYSWNRRSVTDPVDNMFLGGMPPPRSIVQQVNWRDNPWFPNVLREEMEWDKSRDHDKYLHVWEGEPIQRSEAKVFKNWRIDDLDDKIPDGCVPRFGGDWGFSVDPTALVKCYIWERTLYFTDEAYKVGCEIDDTPALFASVSESDKYPIIADSSRPETISYMRKHGFPKIKKAIKGPGSVEEGVKFMQNYDIVVHPRCAHVIDELGLYSYKIDKLTDEILPELADKDNHMIDACRYAVESARRKLNRGGSGAVPEVFDFNG